MFKKTSAVHKKGKIKRRVIDPSKIMLLKQLAVGLAVFSVLGLFVTALWYGTRIEVLTINKVIVTGGQTISHEMVEKITAETLAGTYIGIIPRQFAWWYPAEEIIENVAKIPRMKDPLVLRVDSQTLSVVFNEYEPYALWCAERSNENCLFIDSAGYAFSNAPKLSGGAFLRYRTLGKELAVGEKMIEQNDLIKMEEFVELVEKNLKFSITQIETDTAGDVFYILAGGGEFKASLKDDVEKVFPNLQTILTSDEFADLKPGSFQYIDLRFGNKVFVNKEVVVVGSTASSTMSSTSATSTVPAPVVPAVTPEAVEPEAIASEVKPAVLPPRPAEEELPE